MKMSIGQTVEIIYLDKAGKITQRKIDILGIRVGRIRAACLTTGAPRVFLADSILSWRPVAEKRHVG
jgi:predicted DNA-binding transcriptional regulator YafY